jgi:hypothetical protein
MSLLLANIAVPAVFPQPLLAIAVLLPIAAVETLTLRAKFGLSFRRVLEANLISAVLGIPIAIVWIGFCNWIVNANTGGWGTLDLISRSSLSDPDSLWLLAVFAAGVIVPCFVLSVFSEGLYLRKRSGVVGNRSFWYSLIEAHCYSYTILLIANGLWYATKI